MAAGPERALRSARDCLALPLDVGDLDAAEAMMERVGEWFGIAKVGLELYAEAGPAAFARFHDLGYSVFADLKLHDIPTTVERAARALGRRGVDFANFHASGGTDMLRAGVTGLREGAALAGYPPPVALAVTVLTSDPDSSAFPARLQTAIAAGCDGVVCSMHEVGASRAVGMHTMVPGIRPAGASTDDQRRTATPSLAVAEGATWLVVGRPVTAVPDPQVAAQSIHDEVERALGRATG